MAKCEDCKYFEVQKADFSAILTLGFGRKSGWCNLHNYGTDYAESCDDFEQG